MCQSSRHFWKCPLCLTVAATEGCSHSRIDCGHCKVAMNYMGRVSGQRLTQTAECCPCDARCTNATGPSCDCSCGGVNHGSRMLVTVTIDCGPVPVANVKPTAQALWDLKEYMALRQTMTEQIPALKASKQFGAEYRYKTALFKSSRMTSHSGRMRVLRAAMSKAKQPVQASLFG